MDILNILITSMTTRINQATIIRRKSVLDKVLMITRFLMQILRTKHLPLEETKFPRIAI